MKTLNGVAATERELTTDDVEHTDGDPHTHEPSVFISGICAISG